MKISVLSKKSNSELKAFFTKKFAIILVRILTKLGIDISFPTELEELILSIPESEIFFDECLRAYYILQTDNIKENINNLLLIYNSLITIEKSLSLKVHL